MSSAASVRVEVRADTVSRVTDAAGTDITAQSGMSWPSVDSLFARAHAVIANRQLTIQLQFDTQYHYPRLIDSYDPKTENQTVHGATGLAPFTPP